ncbi:glutathione S-transferase omega-1-like [Pomacea canaliculata]|uniref:glutathione S-transferase omega-1-like n=1 Tax=Pomacea canaliculata TaxID=400727 RepID=UPI000D73A7F5|nr:glutathione S-transferase omega-1-like [Pomacea canaliculata]
MPSPSLVKDPYSKGYETINVHLKRKPDWLLARNPKGRVPVLEFSDGRIVFESVITCQYLDDVYPQEPLTPADPYQKARDRLFVDYCDKFMMAIYQLWSSDSNNEKGKATIHVGMQMYEQELTQRNSGNKPTMLDYLIWPWFERLSPFVNPEVMITPFFDQEQNTD